jgi:hypothetical protein
MTQRVFNAEIAEIAEIGMRFDTAPRSGASD